MYGSHAYRGETTVPTGTKVDYLYEILKKRGYDQGSAARIAQAKTGLALATGKPPKHPKK